MLQIEGKLTLLPIVEDGYENEDTPISLFAGYDKDGNQLSMLPAIRDYRHQAVNELEKRLRRDNYVLLEDEADKLLSKSLRLMRGGIDSGTSLYRARIGFKASGVAIKGFNSERHFSPFENKELGAPPPYLAKAGRLNRANLAYLYLAESEQTAISEVRPHPGHRVSVGQFMSVDDIKIADLAGLKIRDFCDSDQSLDRFAFLNHLNTLFSQPITPDEMTKYLITQLFADSLRRVGFGGVRYKSSVGDSANVVVFDPSRFAYVEKSARVVIVDTLSYVFSPVVTYDPGNGGHKYLTDLNGDVLSA